MGGYTHKGFRTYFHLVVICLQISNFEWVDTPNMGMSATSGTL